jgi:hypothetical protein
MNEHEGALSLRGILFGPSDEAGAPAALRQGAAVEAVDRHTGRLPPGLRAAGRDEVLRIVADVLGIPFIDVLAGGWRKWDAIVAAARQSLEEPGETEVVELVDHRIASTHRPRIEIHLDGRPFAEIVVELDVTIDVHALSAVITGGRLSALRSGRADVDVALAIGGLTVAEETRRIELPIEIDLGGGIPIADATAPQPAVHEATQESPSPHVAP